MNSLKNVQAVVLGDPFNNTLGLIRSLGEAGINIILILVGENDRIFLSKSKYLKKKWIYKISKIDDCTGILRKIHDSNFKQYVLATNDIAAKYIDMNESWLSQMFVTPMRGKQIGDYFNKDKQCELAVECGFDVPKSFIYNRGDNYDNFNFYPILLKPVLSIEGEKSDIHICKNIDELKFALSQNSKCNKFIVQEYIEKEFEINILGVSNEQGVFCPGGIKKIRHYPTIYSPCSFGKYISVKELNIDIEPIKRFLNKIGYKGLFSVELLRKKEKNYFMEFNFRNDGLAYTATCAGLNIPKMLLEENIPIDFIFKSIYMMDYSTDLCHVKDKNITLYKWICDFLKTKCHLYLNVKDLNPILSYYKSKILSKFRR